MRRGGGTYKLEPDEGLGLIQGPVTISESGYPFLAWLLYKGMWGVSELAAPYWGAYEKGILLFGGSILGVPYFGNLPCIESKKKRDKGQHWATKILSKL